ncbi:MAG: LysR family transcriptional regulator [Deltaproteobacteria bacterium]
MLDDLRVFVAVAKHRNVTRASKELHISQPAVTKHLRLLEDSYNAKFYTRGGEGIELTQIGREFLRDVRTFLRHHERLQQKVRESISRSKTVSLTVGGSSSPSASLLPSLFAGFKKTHPHVQLNLRTGTKPTIERMVLNSEVDIAIINNASSNQSLTIEPYREEPLVVFASKRHPLAKKRRLAWQDFERVPLLIKKSTGTKGTTERFLQSLKKKGLKPNLAMRCDSPEMVKALVKRQMGAGILFRETVEPEIKKGEFKIIQLPEQNYEAKSFIVFRKERPLSNVAQEFLQVLRKRK